MLVYMCFLVDTFDVLMNLMLNKEHMTLIHHEGEFGDESSTVRLLRVLDHPDYETMARSCRLSGLSDILKCISADKEIREIALGAFSCLGSLT